GAGVADVAGDRGVDRAAVRDGQAAGAGETDIEVLAVPGRSVAEAIVTRNRDDAAADAQSPPCLAAKHALPAVDQGAPADVERAGGEEADVDRSGGGPGRGDAIAGAARDIDRSVAADIAAKDGGAIV